MKCAAAASDERGMLSVASLFAVLGLVVGFALVANISKTVAVKLEAQNTADAAAYAAGVELARGLNAVTTANHLIGELQALVVLHHSIGGDELDGLKSPARTPADLRSSLSFAYNVARTVSSGSAPAPQFYNSVSQEPQFGASAWDSRIELKKIMTWAYVAHAGGAILTQLKWIPYVGQVLYAVGMVIVVNALVFEGKVYQEWLTLDVLERLAQALRPLKATVRTAIIPGLYLYSCRMAGAVPFIRSPLPIPGEAGAKAEEAAFALGEKQLAEASLFPAISRNTTVPVLALPVVPEPATLRQPVRSQLVRASTPWIQKWRTAWMRWGEDALLMSRFKCHYKKWSDTFTLELAQRQKRDYRTNLLILRELDLDGADKTNEPWTRSNGSATTDKLFSVMGFARRPAPPIAAFGYFRQPNPDGVVAFAQALVYNANPHRPGANRNGWQKITGWDTLNWDNDVPEYPGPNPSGEDCPVPNVPEPRVRLNWQTKLVPTTRLFPATWWQQGDLGEVLRRTPSYLPGASTTH